MCEEDQAGGEAVGEAGGAGAGASLGGDGSAGFGAVGAGGIDAFLGRHGGLLVGTGNGGAQGESSAGLGLGRGLTFGKLLKGLEIQLGEWGDWASGWLACGPDSPE